jgi:serine/threonine protein kinase
MALASVKRQVQTATTVGHVTTHPRAMTGLAVVEEYVIGERLDDGGSNQIYAAACRNWPGRVAVKLLGRALDAGKDAAEACRREAAQVARLGHPHVAQVLAFGTTTDGTPFLVREHLEGQTLESSLFRRGPMPMAEVLPIVRTLAAALAASHAAGVVHGEVRPRKVFLTAPAGYAGGFVKLVDFGLSRIAADRRGPGAMADVARYTAPEQLDRARAQEVDGRADQFALAAIAYRMICGVDAFPGDDVAAVLDRVEHRGPAPIGPEIDRAPRVEVVLRRALARDPRQRYASVLELAGALDEVAAPRRVAEVTQTVSAAEILEVSPVAASERERWFEELEPAPALDDELRAHERAFRSRAPRGRLRVVLLAALLSSTASAAWWGGWAPPVDNLVDAIVELER